MSLKTLVLAGVLASISTSALAQSVYDPRRACYGLHPERNCSEFNRSCYASFRARYEACLFDARALQSRINPKPLVGHQVGRTNQVFVPRR